MKFKAAVLGAVGATALSVETLVCADLMDDDVLIRMAASGLCHTDLEVMQGTVSYPVPIVLGHEGAGVVEAVGRRVHGVSVGDHVVCSWNPHCGHCFHCERDQPILCEPLAAHQRAGHLMGGGSRYSLDGQPVHHFAGVSSHAEYCVVTADSAVVIPREMPLDRACLIGCAVMTGVGAVARLAQVPAGSSVIVIGTGAVGLNAIQGAVIQRAHPIIAVDRHPARLELAKRLGATHALLADDAGLLETVKAVTAGRGADYAIECAGQEASIRLALEATRRGGGVVLLGKTPVNQLVALRFGALMGEKRIVRSSYGGARPQRDFPWLAKLYLDGVLKLDELVMERLELADINRGFDAMRAGQAVRSIVQFAGA